MQKTTGHKIKLGIFVAGSLCLLLAGIYFIGQRRQLFSKTFRVSGIFKDINGLQVGNNVRFSGINVGIISDIQQITDSTVKVGMMIDDNSRKFLKKNAKALISSDGLMGNKIIIIIPGPGSKEELSDGDMIETAKAVSMNDILVKIKITSDNAATITGDLAAITQNIRNGKGTVGKLFMDTVFAKDIDKTLITIKQGAGGFKQNMAAASKNVFFRGFFKKKRKKEKNKDRD